MSDAPGLTITRPDDWHLHLRDGPVLGAVLPHTARCFARAIVMPNLTPPVTTTRAALGYRTRILAALPGGMPFEPLMTLYLTDSTSREEITRAAADPYVVAAKLYPAGATTHSDAGVTDIANTWAVLESMAEFGLPLLVHGEVTDPQVDVFDREARFVERVLARVRERVPELRIVFEHITTREAVQFVLSCEGGVAATVTPQHMLLNRNALFHGGLRPHHYCLPVLKAEGHRRAVAEAATSGDARFFLGTDSAPHPRGQKESACGCAGIFSAPTALELYAQAFEDVGCLDRLEAFASYNGADFYGLPRNTSTIRLVREDWTPPAAYDVGSEALVPFGAGDTLRWRLAPAARQKG